jgi:UDP-N-acetyl-D-mannosaminuronate dehydrogenase
MSVCRLRSPLRTRAFSTIGFDVDPGKIELMGAGSSYIYAVKSDHLAELVA